MENLNEVRPKKFKVVKDDKIVIETDFVNEARSAYQIEQSGHWKMYRNGELVEEQKIE